MPLLRPQLRFVFASFVGVAVSCAAETIDFSRQILPILSDACFRCHGPDGEKRKAKLRLDEHDGLFRTEDGVTIVAPGKPKESELILRITNTDPEDVMPPRDSMRQLTKREIEL